MFNSLSGYPAKETQIRPDTGFQKRSDIRYKPNLLPMVFQQNNTKLDYSEIATLKTRNFKEEKKTLRRNVGLLIAYVFLIFRLRF